MRHFASGRLVGVGQGRETLIASDAPSVWSGIGFHPGLILGDDLPENRPWSLGQCGLLVAEAAPRTLTRLRYAVAFHRDGIVSTGLDARYLYNRWFGSVESAASFALARFDEAKTDALRQDEELVASGAHSESAVHAGPCDPRLYGQLAIARSRSSPALGRQ